MTYSRIVTIFTASALCLAVSTTDVAAQRGGGGGRSGGGGGGRSGGGGGGRPSGGGTVTGRAVARPPVQSGRGVVVAPYGGARYYGGAHYGYGYPYYRAGYYGYGYRPYYYPYSGFGFGFYASFGYPYGYYSSPYRYGYPYAYAYATYGYPVAPAAGYSAQVSGSGGVRIKGAPHQAQVFVDGYYVGVADDFDGAFQQLNLEAGAHELEIRIPGRAPSSYDVNVQPGLTMTIHAGFQ
jgi:hypothetical protein